MFIYRACLALFIFFAGINLTPSRAQVNLNMKNGMPSNHVYCMLKDNYGYLWMATTNGVVRYNGYELKTYTLTDGLPSNDVWNMHLDKKGRLWLACFTSRPGYIYNMKYRSTYVDDQDYTLYFRWIRDHEDGVALMSYFANSPRHSSIAQAIFREKNDTIKPVFYDDHGLFFDLNSEGKFIYGKDTEFIIRTYQINDNGLTLKNRCSYDSTIFLLKASQTTWTTFKNFDIGYNSGEKFIYRINFSNCRLDTLSITGTLPVEKMVQAANGLYVFSTDTIYRLDARCSVVSKYVMPVVPADSSIGLTNVLWYFDDDFWGHCVSTAVNGCYIDQKKESFFKRVKQPDLSGYNFVGYSLDSSGYWWSTATRTMAIIDRYGAIKYRKYNINEGVRKFLPFNKEFSLLFANNAPWLVDNKTGDAKKPHVVRLDWGKNARVSYSSATDACIRNDTIYSISSHGMFRSYLDNDTLYGRPALKQRERYTGINYDPLANLIWLYNARKVLIVDGNDRALLFSDRLLGLLGINRVEQMVVDHEFGNIFIKDVDKLLMINTRSMRIEQLFNQCDLSDARLYKQGHMLVAAGTFGVLFSRILGLGKVSDPIIRLNEKNRFYLQVRDVQFLQQEVWLNTDNGLYSVPIPDNYTLARRQHGQPYRIILGYNDSLHQVNSGDSFSIGQNSKLVFDIIKPTGSGQVKYQYFVAGTDSAWHQLSTNEFYFPDIKPGYHTLLLRVRDNAWKSPILKFHFYIVPYWWQTNRGKAVIWLVGLLFITVLVLSTVLVTRRIIDKNNARKNKMLELEIKSIYSQINPHFIFNTLNTSLHYIVKKKLDEAYDHISSFSSLLRAYLKSSRNRFITLPEEVTNLRNYISLQQTRFENSFTCEIITDVPDDKIIRIPSLLFQPIVENAINHGLLPKKGPGHLSLSFIMKPGESMLSCIIEDDGIGRQRSREDRATDNKNKESYGSQLINELVEVFNKYENTGIEIEYIDKPPPSTGTIIKIILKNT